MKKLIIIFVTLITAGCAAVDTAPKRSVAAKITSNLDNATVYYRVGSQQSFILGKTPLQTKIMIPVGNVTLGAYPGTKKFTATTPESIEIAPDQTSVEFHVEYTDTAKLLGEEFSGFELELKKKLVSIIDAYTVVISTPNYLKESKGDEATALLNQLMLEYPEFKSTKFYGLLRGINHEIRFSAFLKNNDYVEPINIARDATGQI